MASIINSKAKFYELHHQSEDEANHCIESEADLFIKELSQKQLNTNITLQEQLNYKKEFQFHHTYHPENTGTVGVVPYEKIQDICDNEEISRLQESSVDDHLENRNISRHVKELALAVKPNSLETTLLKFAIKCNAVGLNQCDNRPQNHPINQLSNIESNLFSHLSETSNPKQSAKTVLRKRKQLLESISDPIEIKSKPILPKRNSQWDVTETSKDHVRSKRRKLFTCENERLFSIQNNEIIEINKNVYKNMEMEEEVRTEGFNEMNYLTFKQLTEEEIKAIPKFSSYNKGLPNKTLYLKNLAITVKEEDLSSLFEKYQKLEKARITYKLMKKGKMRGQAFVNFNCIETASKALEELNGVFFHEKLLVIQFSSYEKEKK